MGEQKVSACEQWPFPGCFERITLASALRVLPDLVILERSREIKATQLKQ